MQLELSLRHASGGALETTSSESWFGFYKIYVLAFQQSREMLKLTALTSSGAAEVRPPRVLSRSILNPEMQAEGCNTCERTNHVGPWATSEKTANG